MQQWILLLKHFMTLLCLRIPSKLLVFYVRPSMIKYLPVSPAFGCTTFVSQSTSTSSAQEIYCLLNVTGSVIHRCSSHSLNANSTTLTPLSIFIALFTSLKSFHAPWWNILPSYSSLSFISFSHCHCDTLSCFFLTHLFLCIHLCIPST